jgi:hypothetical protein
VIRLGVRVCPLLVLRLDFDGSTAAAAGRARATGSGRGKLNLKSSLSHRDRYGAEPETQAAVVITPLPMIRVDHHH